MGILFCVNTNNSQGPGRENTLNLSPETRSNTTALILAGGRARRMGGADKGLVQLAGKAMVEWVVDALRPQCRELLVNANRHEQDYARLSGCKIIADQIPDYAGPLAGMASGLNACATPYLVIVPCDSPLIQDDLVTRLHQALVDEDTDLSVAHDGQRMQPVFAMIKRELEQSLLDYLADGGRKIDHWYRQHLTALADFRDSDAMFLNINTPEDRTALEARLQEPPA